MTKAQKKFWAFFLLALTFLGMDSILLLLFNLVEIAVDCKDLVNIADVITRL